MKNKIAFDTLTFLNVIEFNTLFILKHWHSFRKPRSKRDADNATDGSAEEEEEDEDYYYDDENE